jgi:hypothetical protein
VKPAHNQRLFRLAASSAIAPVSKYSPRREQNSQFDIALAVILAGYAFESYNEPSVGKVAMGLDSTKITFTSADFIRRAFAGVLLLSLNKGTFKADAIEEEQLLEKMVTGADPDPYVSISVVEPGARRVLDAARSSDKVEGYWHIYTNIYNIHTHACYFLRPLPRFRYAMQITATRCR